MSRRKQLNPKPLNKGDCSDTAEKMTVEDSGDSKDLSPNDLTDDQDQKSDPLTMNEETDVEMHEFHGKKEQIADQITNSENDPYQKIKPLDEQVGSLNSFERDTRTPACNAEDMDMDMDDATSEISVEPRFSTTTTPSPKKTDGSSRSPSPSSMLPKLRLNVLLASDPALKPDAKDLKAAHEESQQQQQRLAQLPAPPPLKKQQDSRIDSLISTPVDPNLKSMPAANADIPTRMKVFMCPPCGIGFSSPSTLEAHQAFYCSHRNKEIDEDNTSVSPNGTNLSTGSIATAGGTVGASGEPTAKSIKTGKQYACHQCSYSADKKVSLNRHMRMHQTSPAISVNAANGIAPVLTDDNSSQQIDRYCSDCDIRFNNVKTYRAHKQHYCSSRRTDGHLTPKLEVTTTNTSSKSASVSGESAISPQNRQSKTPTPGTGGTGIGGIVGATRSIQQPPPPQPFLALPTNPIIIIPYSLLRAASLIPGPLTTTNSNIVNPENTCFTLENSALKPLATALNISSLSASNSSSNCTPPKTTNIYNQQSNSDATLQPMATSSEMSGNEQTMQVEKNTHLDVHVTPTTSNATAMSNKRRETREGRETAPLDLSCRRSPVSITSRQRVRSASSFLDNVEQQQDMEVLINASKENLSREQSAGSLTPEQIVCAPSLPNSPSISPSPKRRAVSPRSSGAGSASSMSPPVNVSAATLAAAANNMLDSLPLHSMLSSDLALKFKMSEQNLMSPLLAKQSFELALKLSAAVAASTGTPTGNTAAEIAGKSGSFMGLPGTATSNSSSVGTNQPQIYVKQGVSKCKECNIVFCKYDNYLAHKQRYCSARNQEGSESESAKHAHTPPITPGASAAETTPMAYQQLICAACGIKYTSLDNLRAHQNYYCPKGGGAAKTLAAAVAAAAASNVETEPVILPKEKCNKCKTMHDINKPCALPSQSLTMVPQQQTINNQNVYKCPVCDAISVTASDSRKHMETHGTVKAFRCTICRYKGNTLRGMRTHIRMHFDKKTTDLNEERYMTCILEDESTEMSNVSLLMQEQFAQKVANVHQQHQKQQQQQQQQAVAVAAAAALNLQQQQQPTQIFNCDICNYSSSYKGNVLRHMKLVHPHLITSSPSISPEAVGDMDNFSEGGASLSGSLNGDSSAQSFVIKSEPLEHSSTNIPITIIHSQPHHDNSNSPMPVQLPPPPATTNHSTNMELMSHIKTEPMDMLTESTTNNSMLLSPSPKPTSTTTTIATAAAAVIPTTMLSTTSSGEALKVDESAAALMNQKYCQTCDISFTYMNTFLAHKQYYCKNKLRQPDLNKSPSPNAANLVLPATMHSPNSLLNVQKNKENMQQEAAI